MTRAYKFTHLPEGYSVLATAAWQVLTEHELYEIEGKLVFTDAIEEYLLDESEVHYDVHEFDSHAAFEKWLLEGIAGWIKDDPSMIEDLDQYLELA